MLLIYQDNVIYFQSHMMKYYINRLNVYMATVYGMSLTLTFQVFQKLGL